MAIALVVIRFLQCRVGGSGWTTVAQHRVTRVARARARYTGETYQTSLSAIVSRDLHADPIPAAESSDQCELEGDLFERVLDHGDYSTFPFCVARVIPSAQVITVIPESPRRARTLLGAILPCHDGHTLVSGISGLRIYRRTRDGLILNRAGHHASVRLAGFTRAIWSDAERDLAHTAADRGLSPCWLEATERLTEPEHANDHEQPPMRQASLGAAWLASGLLRRLRIFHDPDVQALITGWRALALPEAKWCLDIEHPNPRAHQAHLITALTDPSFGLPLRLTRLDDKPNSGTRRPTIVDLTDEARTGQLTLHLTNLSGAQSLTPNTGHPAR